MHTEKMKYQDGNIVLEGYLAEDKNKKGKKPAVIVAHDWSGRNEFAERKAELLAEWGYIGFAIDMYGIGKLGKTTEEKMGLMKPLKDDRAALRERILSGFNALKTVPDVDLNRIAAIGFCFGGLCVLDLARSGADLKGIVSFHGLLDKPRDLASKEILAKVLVLHGHDDPSVPPEQVLAFEKEMTNASVDWQVHVYGGVVHGFTNPHANDKASGIVFNPLAEKRSMLAMKNFLEEVLG